jgi:hypothetical protein
MKHNIRKWVGYVSLAAIAATVAVTSSAYADTPKFKIFLPMSYIGK